jgi:hypothetical protein
LLLLLLLLSLLLLLLLLLRFMRARSNGPAQQTPYVRGVCHDRQSQKKMPAWWGAVVCCFFNRLGVDVRALFVLLVCAWVRCLTYDACALEPKPTRAPAAAPVLGFRIGARSRRAAACPPLGPPPFQLTELDLDGNGISAEGGIALGAFLRAGKAGGAGRGGDGGGALRRLSLAWNDLGAEAYYFDRAESA